MNFYLESNFILELAYLQEEHASCEKILETAINGGVRLILPAFAIAEPYSAWVGRKKRREAVHADLTRELRELARSEPYAATRDQFQDVTRALLVSGEEEKSRLDQTIEAVIQSCSLIPIEADTIRTSIDIQLTTDLGPQDSIVYASIISHLINVAPAGEKYFVTKNSKDFDNPDITEELTRYGCSLCTSFGEAYGILHRLLQG
jgi:predicted nucleic acid-binding protein